MAASTGVYPFNDRVEMVLWEDLYVMTNREILARQLLEPVYDILSDVKEGKCSEYVARERLRQWEEHVDEELQVWWGFPTWEELLEYDFEGGFFLDDWIDYSGYEWAIACDDDSAVWEVAYGTQPDGTAEDAVAFMVKNYKTEVIIVHVRDESIIQVLHSKKVRHCRGIYSESGRHTGYCDARELGSVPTYVLPTEIEQRIDEEEEKYEQWYAETYAAAAG